MFQDQFNGEENLRLLIQKLKQRGYQFAGLSDYVRINSQN